MKGALSYLWYVFLLGSWSVILLVFHRNWPAQLLYLVLVLGLIFYALKLYYFNSLPLTEINYLTILFDVLLYIYIFLSGMAIWLWIYKVWNEVDPEHFRRYFSDDVIYYTVARRIVLTNASMGIVLFIVSGVNHTYPILKFTNKIWALEAALVGMSLLWLVMDMHNIGMFVSIVSMWSMPEHLKRGIGWAAKYFFKKDVDLINVKIENNMVDVPYKPFGILGHAVSIIALVFMPLFYAIVVQLPLAVVFLVVGVIIRTPIY